MRWGIRSSRAPTWPPPRVTASPLRRDEVGGRFNSQTARAVIASEAKQSMPPHKESMDCFVASLLAMTTVRSAHLRARLEPLGHETRFHPSRRAQEHAPQDEGRKIPRKKFQAISCPPRGVAKSQHGHLFGYFRHPQVRYARHRDPAPVLKKQGRVGRDKTPSTPE